MTTPRVTELRRRLEATSPDTFLASAPDDEAPLATVVQLRQPGARRRRPPPRRAAPPLRLVGPGDSAA